MDLKNIDQSIKKQGPRTLFLDQQHIWGHHIWADKKNQASTSIAPYATHFKQLPEDNKASTAEKLCAYMHIYGVRP